MERSACYWAIEDRDADSFHDPRGDSRWVEDLDPPEITGEGTIDSGRVN